MGQTGSYELLGNINHLKDFLLELKNYLMPLKQEVQIELPTGEKILLSAALQIDLSSHQSGRYHIKLSQKNCSETLALSLKVPMDQQIQDYYLESGQASGYSSKHASNSVIGLPRSIQLGYVYFNLRLDELSYRASFWAATSDMSRLFQESLSIRLLFTQLLLFGKALNGVFDSNGYIWTLLSTQATVLPYDDFLAHGSPSDILKRLQKCEKTH